MYAMSKREWEKERDREYDRDNSRETFKCAECGSIMPENFCPDDDCHCPECGERDDFVLVVVNEYDEVIYEI